MGDAGAGLKRPDWRKGFETRALPSLFGERMSALTAGWIRYPHPCRSKIIEVHRSRSNSGFVHP